MDSHYHIKQYILAHLPQPLLNALKAHAFYTVLISAIQDVE